MGCISAKKVTVYLDGLIELILFCIIVFILTYTVLREHKVMLLCISSKLTVELPGSCSAIYSTERFLYLISGGLLRCKKGSIVIFVCSYCQIVCFSQCGG